MWKGWTGTCFDVKWQKMETSEWFLQPQCCFAHGTTWEAPLDQETQLSRLRCLCLAQQAQELPVQLAHCYLWSQETLRKPSRKWQHLQTAEKSYPSTSTTFLIILPIYRNQSLLGWFHSVPLENTQTQRTTWCICEEEKGCQDESLGFFFRKPTLFPSGSHGPLSSMIDLSKNQNMINIDKYI